MTFVVEAAVSRLDLCVQLREIVRADITAFAVLEVAPESIDWIQFGRIPRQAFEMGFCEVQPIWRKMWLVDGC